MADSHAVSLDTAPEARDVQRARWADASPERKARLIEALCEDVRTLSLAGVRQRYPQASAREQTLRVGALTIERTLMIEAFGWDPEREGL
jgi:hypothetical protein